MYLGDREQKDGGGRDEVEKQKEVKEIRVGENKRALLEKKWGEKKEKKQRIKG